MVAAKGAGGTDGPPTDQARSAADRVARALAVAGGALLMAMMLLTFADVAGRTFGHPIGGAKEATEVMLAVTVFLLLPVISWEGRHIVIDMLDGFVPRAAQGPQRRVASLLGALACGFAAWALGRQALAAFDYGDRIAYLDLPTGWVVGTMTVLLVLTALAFLGAALRKETPP